jgi:hypothetical protein
MKNIIASGILIVGFMLIANAQPTTITRYGPGKPR